MIKLLTKRREPFKFMLGVGIFGIVFIFLALSFIYVMRKSSADWVNFKLPAIFWVSTAFIVLSSLSLNGANKAFKREEFSSYKWLTGCTLTLGILFIITQLIGWQQLVKMGVIMRNNPAGAFLYVLSGLHILHIIGGIVFLSIAFIDAIKRTTYVDAFVYSINPPNQLRLKLVTIYWHFVDILWIYLFLFFLYHHSSFKL
jgi:cytochrome c oxidase subunit 3